MIASLPLKTITMALINCDGSAELQTFISILREKGAKQLREQKIEDTSA
jgi:hypothetical protein